MALQATFQHIRLVVTSSRYKTCIMSVLEGSQVGPRKLDCIGLVLNILQQLTPYLLNCSNQTNVIRVNSKGMLCNHTVY